MTPEELSKQNSSKIADLEKGLDAVKSGEVWAIIISCIAITLIIIMFFIFKFYKRGDSRQEHIRNMIREYLAIGIVIVGILIVGLLGLVAMATGDDDFRREALAGILPLIGAWVGAVIAYYFGKENFQAASDSTARLLSRDEWLAKTPVSKIMLPIEQIDDIIRVDDLDKFKERKIKETAQEVKRNRAPVLDHAGLPLLIIHKSTLFEYLAQDQDRQEHTFENMRTNADNLWVKINAFGTIKLGTTAAEVKTVMQNVGPNCSDVFVTQDGSKQSAVIGLITNVDLLKADYL